MLATLSWDNNVEEKFAPVVKTIISAETGRNRSESRVKRSEESRVVDLTQTTTVFRLAELGWGSRVSLQVILGDITGPQSEQVEVFSEEVKERYLSPLTDLQVSTILQFRRKHSIMDLIINSSDCKILPKCLKVCTFMP